MSLTPVVLAAVVAVSPQQAKKPAAAAAPAMAPTVAALVNNTPITAAQVREYLAANNARRVVQELIQRTIVEQEAKKQGVTVTDAEIAVQVKEEKAKIISQMAQSSGEMLTFAQITRKFGLTENEIAQTVRLNLLARKAYTKKLEKEVSGLDGQVKLAHILLATVPLGPNPAGNPVVTPEEQKKKDEEVKGKIDQILADIKAGKVKFEDAAKQSSDDKGSGAQGGELPYAGKGTFVPEFEKVAFALQKPGDLSEPVKSQFGWHIIKLIRKGSDATPAEKAKYKKDQVDRLLAQPQALQQWLVEVSRGAKINFNPGMKLFPK